MRPNAVVELQILFQMRLRVIHGPICMEIDLLVLDSPPESLHKDIVTPTPFAIHADTDPIRLKEAGKISAGKLAALIRVEDIRSPVKLYGFFYRLNAEICGQRVGEPPG